ncbi:hypothetical protein QYS50_20045 (plasmid) [Deinococcus altitudinis]
MLNFTASSGRAVFRRTEPDEVPSGRCAAFLMLPYSNRIENARFTYEATRHQLRPGDDGHARHGDVRDRPWQVEAASGTGLTCTFDSRRFTDLNWPWAFTARVSYRLQGPVLSVSLSITNADTTAMPAGMGLHPYVQRRDGPDDPELTFTAKGLYLTDHRLIPSRAAQAIPAERDFSAGRAGRFGRRLAGEKQHLHPVNENGQAVRVERKCCFEVSLQGILRESTFAAHFLLLTPGEVGDLRRDQPRGQPTATRFGQHDLKSCLASSGPGAREKTFGVSKPELKDRGAVLA